MAQEIFIDVFGDEIVMIESVRARTLEKHPEAASFIDYVGEVLATPDEVRRSNRDERGMLYYLYKQDILGGKWIVIVVKQIERKYFSTMYATNKIKSGEVLWTR